MLFAITDLETTGGHPSEHGITEISILLHDGAQVVDRFYSLVNPERPIPYYITKITGIDDQTVENAPIFSDIALEVRSFIEDTVFVAHNVSFDYSFLKESFFRAGIAWNASRICTVKLSRKIFPGLPSYSLKGLCDSLNIVNPSPHRAWGDTEATAGIFEHLYAADHSGFILKAVKSSDPEGFLPAWLDADFYRNLPEEPGVYYFHDEKGEVLYVGKARNIKARIRSHFNGNYLSFKRQELAKRICGITFEETGNELIALLLEDQEIRRLWPPLNSAQKVRTGQFGIYSYSDQNDLQRLAIRRKEGVQAAIRVFDSYGAAREWLLSFARNNDLPLAICGINEGDKAAENNGQLELKLALAKLELERETYVIPGRGRRPDEQSFILVRKGEPNSFGYLPQKAAVYSTADLDVYRHALLQTSGPGKQLLQGYLENNGGMKIPIREE
jgi:DNA polymerase-3 subunit epsilon